ncbi:MAG: SpoIIE family protein phosphatase [Acidobacteria bacterium]|nr:SpoIIE family protein phosphatase [Acidobacteriota bacterium]
MNVRHVLLAAAVFAASCVARADEPFRIGAALDKAPYVALPYELRHTPQDDPAFAAPGFDDSAWPKQDARLLPHQKWSLPGIVWYRTRIELPADVSGRPLALRVLTTGACEVYVDGVKVAGAGRIGPTPETTVVESPLVGEIVTLEPGVRVLAVRFANPIAEGLRRGGFYAGFSLELGHAAPALRSDVDRVERGAAGTWFFTSVFLSFALLHLLLFLFGPDLRENLYFALLCLANATLGYLLMGKAVLRDPHFILFSEPTMGVAGLLFALSSVLFTHEAFGVRRPRAVTGLLLAGFTGLSVWSAFAAMQAVPFVFFSMLFGSAEAVRTVCVAAFRGKPGARLVGAGILAIGLGFGVGLLANLGVDMSFLGPRRVVRAIIPFASVVVLLVLSSVHLARRVAAINRELRERIDEVTRLSEEKLEKERHARAIEVSRKLLEAEFARKAEELEEARQLQISMLPGRPPAIPGFRIAARMQTASEVGGDYYDFDLGPDGALTIAIGDATGHGMRAGTLVTATKSLFGAFAREPELISTMTRAGAALARMNLRALTMALTIVRIKDGQAHIAAAGMPPVLIHRGRTGTVESFLVPGMPLGARTPFPYAQSIAAFGPGDTLLLMSDGLPERLDPNDDMLGYERTLELFREAAHRDVEDLLDSLVSQAGLFAKGRAPEDDVTLVVIRNTTAA